jgi:phage/conjugal plasmid C-4 type zinc finger TraR family protein
MMAVGWSKDGAVQEQIDATVKSGVELARSLLPKGESLTHCEECEEPIPDARRKAIPGVRFCVACQSEFESEEKTRELFNRSGSKDSQLK